MEDSRKRLELRTGICDSCIDALKATGQKETLQGEDGPSGQGRRRRGSGLIPGKASVQTAGTGSAAKETKSDE